MTKRNAAAGALTFSAMQDAEVKAEPSSGDADLRMRADGVRSSKGEGGEDRRVRDAQDDRRRHREDDDRRSRGDDRRRVKNEAMPLAPPPVPQVFAPSLSACM